MPDSTLKTKFWQTGLADLEQQLGVGRDGLSSADACDLLREVRARSRKRGKHSRLAFVVKPSLMSRTRSTTSLSKSRRISSNSRVRPTTMVMRMPIASKITAASRVSIGDFGRLAPAGARRQNRKMPTAARGVGMSRFRVLRFQWPPLHLAGEMGAEHALGSNRKSVDSGRCQSRPSAQVDARS